MAKVDFHPLLKWLRGKLGGLVFRRAHSGKISVYLSPDMSRVRASKAQKDHRQRFREAALYASAAVADPDLRPVYVQMAVDHNRDPRRPFHTAHSDYYQNGNDLLWQKHMGDREKPQNWEMDRYHFYLTRQTPKGRFRFYKRQRRR
jgi:hypothetical protein